MSKKLKLPPSTKPVEIITIDDDFPVVLSKIAEQPLRMNTPIPTKKQEEPKKVATKEEDIAAARQKEAENQKKFSETVRLCGYLLKSVRKLRKQVDTFNSLLYNHLGNPEGWTEHNLSFENFRDLMEPITQSLMNLDKYIIRLPNGLPMIEQTAQMHLYNLELSDNSMKAERLIDHMIDLENWKDQKYHTFFYLSTFLQCGKPPHPKMLGAPALPPPIFSRPTGNEKHGNFVNTLRQMRKEAYEKSMNIGIQILQSTPNSSFVEFLFSFGDYKTEIFGHLIKCLLVEKNGKIDYISMRMPSEDWATTSQFYGDRIINPCADSRYIVYQKLTVQANLLLHGSYGSVVEWKVETLFQLVSLLSKFRDVFSSKCRACKKHLKFMMPPTHMEFRSPGVYWHESCKP